EMASARHAGRSRSIERIRASRIIGRTWDGKGSEVEVVCWIVPVIDDRAHYIRLGKELLRAIVVIAQDHMEGLAGLNGQDAVEAPTVGQPLIAAVTVRELIGEVPRETVAHVKVGVAAIGEFKGAVVGLRSVRHVVLAVARIVDRMRPSV